MIVRKSADQRKTEIVTAMLRLADELGPDRLTTKAVADAVGLTQPAIFRHFPTKQALWAAVAKEITDKMTTAWAEVMQNNTAPKERVTGLILAQLRQIGAKPAIPAILFSRELHVENDNLRQSVLALMTQLTTHLASEFTKGQEIGVFRADLAPKDGAFLLVSLIQGLAIRWSLGGKAFSLEAEGKRLLAIQIKVLSANKTSEQTS
jgi:AcrR family transcriptional regulator